MAIGSRRQEFQNVSRQFQEIDTERGENSVQGLSLLFAVNNRKWRLSVPANGISVVSAAKTLGR